MFLRSNGPEAPLRVYKGKVEFGPMGPEGIRGETDMRKLLCVALTCVAMMTTAGEALACEPIFCLDPPFEEVCIPPDLSDLPPVPHHP